MDAKTLVMLGRFAAILASGGVAANAPIDPCTRCGVRATRSTISSSDA